jgi:hypothetical protein
MVKLCQDMGLLNHDQTDVRYDSVTFSTLVKSVKLLFIEYERIRTEKSDLDSKE